MWRWLRVPILHSGLALIVLYAVSGCAQHDDPTPISEETFTALYTELSLHRVRFLSKEDSLRDTVVYRDSLAFVFKAYDIDPRLFEQQLHYYASNPLEWQRVNSKVTESLRVLRTKTDSIRQQRSRLFQRE